jgi:hypothetical protein
MAMLNNPFPLLHKVAAANGYRGISLEFCQRVSQMGEMEDAVKFYDEMGIAPEERFPFLCQYNSFMAGMKALLAPI